MRPEHRRLAWETVERVGAREAERDAAPAPAAAEPGDSPFAHLRRSSPATVLLPLGRRWLETLPPQVYPRHLAEDFPRLVNLIALDWRDPNAAAKLLSSLLVDTRHGRRGFPPAVRHELRQLVEYSLRRTLG